MSKIDEISKVSRPVLGGDIPILVFRAFRHFSSDYVDEVMGRATSTVFQNGGRAMGKELGEKIPKASLEEYLQSVIKMVKELKIGVLREVVVEEEKIVLALDECITCAGMGNIGKRICHFEVGLVAGLVESFLGTKVRARETKCNANGEGTCEVTVYINEDLYQKEKKS
jgi:predicted hydrocarbon binding protein